MRKRSQRKTPPLSSARKTPDMGRFEFDPSLDTPKPLVKRRGRPADPDRAVEQRRCPRHGLTEFASYRRGSGSRWKCKRCVGEAVTRRKQRVKRLLVDEAGGRCCICGYDRCVVNLHFHHVDPRQKSFGMSMAGGKSLAAFRAEARKCVLVCANCHGEIEAGLTESPPAGAKFGD